MSIHSISSLAPVTSLSILNRPQLPGAAPAQTPAAALKPSAASTTSATTTSASSSKSSPSGKGGAHGSADSSGGSDEATQLAAAYTVTIGGKTYSGTVEESNGQYTASVANLPGASASGSSLQGAEDNLGSVIDVIA